jgi:hypothetical protein
VVPLLVSGPAPAYSPRPCCALCCMLWVLGLGVPMDTGVHGCGAWGEGLGGVPLPRCPPLPPPLCTTPACVHFALLAALPDLLDSGCLSACIHEGSLYAPRSYTCLASGVDTRAWDEGFTPSPRPTCVQVYHTLHPLLCPLTRVYYALPRPANEPPVYSSAPLSTQPRVRPLATPLAQGSRVQ